MKITLYPPQKEKKEKNLSFANMYKNFSTEKNIEFTAYTKTELYPKVDKNAANN